MTAPATSVVIVSRGRPEALVLCVTATAQLRYPLFEVVVVSDPAGLAALTAAGHAVLAGAGGIVVRFDDHTPLAYGKDGFANPFFIAYAPGVVLKS